MAVCDYSYGLKLNASKTVILALTSTTLPVSIIVGSNSVEVLGRTGCSKYLGRNLCLEHLHQAELRNRLRCAWAAFSEYCAICKSRASAAARSSCYACCFIPLFELDPHVKDGESAPNHETENAPNQVLLPATSGRDLQRTT